MSGRPTISALRRRVTLEAPTDALDELGGATRSFAAIATLWAQIESVGAETEFVESRAEQSKTILVIIRWREDVMSGMRFDYRGRKLLIQGAEDADELRRFLSCHCLEIS